MKNMKWMSAALALTLGIVGAGTLASAAQHSPITPVAQVQTAQTDLPETGDVADTVDSPGVGDVADSVDQPEAGDVADQAPGSATDLPEAGDTVDTTTGN
jgi:hypothetical protein